MPRIQNPEIAAVVAQMARGSQSPVKDGTLSPALQPYTYGQNGADFQAVPGPTKMMAAHPSFAVGTKERLPQVPIMDVASGGPARTGPGLLEGQMFGAPRVSHTTGEKGMGPLQMDPEAVIDMLMSMGLPEPVIQQALQEMGYQYGG
jgi:hypothetical protein